MLGIGTYICCFTELVLVVSLLQLATCGFYGDFLLLDPCDAPAVFDFLQGKKSGKEDILAHRGGSPQSKTRKNVFTSPNVRSGGTARRRTPGKVQEDPEQTQETILGQSQEIEDQSPGNINDWSDHPIEHDIPGASMSQQDDDVGCPDPADDSDDEDPYKSLDPHVPSNLKIKPYKRGIGSSCFPDMAGLFPYIASSLIILNLLL